MRSALLALPLLLCACPPPQVQYPSGAVGVVCSSCYNRDRCDPSLLPAEQVDAAVQLVAAALGRKSGGVYVCLVDLPGMQLVPGSWAHGACTTPTVKGTCLAGQSADVTVKITVRDMQGRLLRVWETALAHELCHFHGLMEGEQMSKTIEAVNAELKRRWP